MVSRARVIEILNQKESSGIKTVQIISYKPSADPLPDYSPAAAVINAISLWKDPTKNHAQFDLSLINPPKISSIKIVRQQRVGSNDESLRTRGPRRTDFDGFIFNPVYKASRSCDNYWEPVSIPKHGTDGVFVILHGHNKGFSNSIGHKYSASQISMFKGILNTPIYGIRDKDEHFIDKK